MFKANPAVGGDVLVKGFRRLAQEKRLRWLFLRPLNRYCLRGDFTGAYNLFPVGLDMEPSLSCIPLSDQA